MLTVACAIAKTNKYASRDSGDTAEVVERPGGGLSVVLVDGQGSGRAAKLLSTAVVGQAIALLKEGVRDGAVARAVHDSLYAYRGGQVSATLDILSLDLASQTLVLCRNSHCPVLWRDAEGSRLLIGQAPAIGRQRHGRPASEERPIVAGSQIILISDGIVGAGQRRGQPLDLAGWLAASDPTAAAPALADGLLAAALAADADRPQDDMTVVALTIQTDAGLTEPLIRRLTLTLPLTSLAPPRL
jgi:serine phosphatase RsbU (regulator of sigma subunit)